MGRENDAQLNVDVPKELKKALDVHAANTGKKLKHLVAEVLGEYLENQK